MTWFYRHFAQQDTENKMVENELNLIEDDASVYKLVGPVLLKQELSDVKHNVSKRLEYFTESFMSELKYISWCPKEKAVGLLPGKLRRLIDNSNQSNRNKKRSGNGLSTGNRTCAHELLKKREKYSTSKHPAS